MDDTFGDSLSFAGLSIFSSSLLHSKSVIDQTFKTRKALAYGFAYSWLAHSIVLKSYADLYVTPRHVTSRHVTQTHACASVQLSLSSSPLHSLTFCARVSGGLCTAWLITSLCSTLRRLSGT
jgi:hypothetical protein